MHLFTTYNEETKASIVERLNRTLKTKMWKYFTQRNPNLRRRSIGDGRILLPHRSQNHRHTTGRSHVG
jgi:hypothetical protein